MNDWKQQILKSIPTTRCCGNSFIATMLANCAIVDEDDHYILFNALDAVINKLMDVVKKFYPNLEILYWENFLMLRGNLYEFLVDCNAQKFDLSAFDQECDRLTILKTLFLLHSNLYYNKDSNLNSKGYNLELVIKDEKTYDIINTLLLEFGFGLKTSKRKNNFVIYTKNGDLICDLLVKLGANYAALDIQNNLAMREVRNTANRQNNCFGYNLDKTLNSSSQQMEAITYLFENDMLDSLDENLKEIALLRLANPDVSLSELKTLYGKPISRAGLKYRLDKIIDIYKKQGENR